MSRIILVLAFALLLPVSVGPQVSAIAQENGKTQIIRSQRGAYMVEVIDNSPTLSQALAVNKLGAIIGVRESANAEQTIFSQVFFYCDGKTSTDLPLLEGFTNVEALALSDNGLVAGMASRPIGSPGGSLTAIVWDSTSGKITNLGFPEGYAAAHAQDISADGTRITGYVSGAEPARMQPCVWSRQAGEDKWQAEVLPTPHDYNPLLLSARAIISPDGKYVAACCTDALVNNVVDSSLFVWQQAEGKWKPSLRSKEAFFLRDMNNEGLIVGSISKPNGLRFPCYMDEDAKLKMIELLPEDESGEAWGVNAEGTIVGFSDDPRGPQGGPQAFAWKEGKTSAIDLGDVPYSAAYAINDAGAIAGLLDTLIAGAAVPTEKTLAFRALAVPKEADVKQQN